jgi:GTP-binding protein Era
MTDQNFRAGFLGLIGQPNAGKSSLMNFLISERVSIVTPKPQTTRRRILGLTTTEQGQIVFVDAPGIIKAKSGLNQNCT